MLMVYIGVLLAEALMVFVSEIPRDFTLLCQRQ
jgi:hypothetical protein